MRQPLITRPMLAVDYDPSKLKFPVIASPKLDGFRCIKEGGKVLTRSFKLHPNDYVRELVGQLPDGLDGELIIKGGNFRDCQSDLKCSWTRPEFEYCVFDYVAESLSKPFADRLVDLHNLQLPNWCRVLKQRSVISLEDLDVYEAEELAKGHEGIILREMESPYKCNRSTLNEGYMLKVKRFVDAEAEIIGFFEQEENSNEAVRNELGLTLRSSHQSGRSGKGTLGGLQVRDLISSQEFKIGTGLGWTKDWRLEVYNNQDKYRGRVITYKHLPHGNYDSPRNASMKGFREEWDMEASDE